MSRHADLLVVSLVDRVQTLAANHIKEMRAATAYDRRNADKERDMTRANERRNKRRINAWG